MSPVTASNLPVDPSFPFPPDDLNFRVTGHTDRQRFYDTGRQSVADIQAALARVGRTLESHKTILDFGCGCGRILLWVKDLARSSRLYGVDIDRQAIAWLQQHLTEAHLFVGPPLPPWDFPDGFFDLVYCHSVFTHINEAYQDAWLKELRRVTEPGAMLVVSFHGEHAFQGLEQSWWKAGRDPRPERERLEREGLVFMEDDGWGSIFPDFYHSTFHAPWYIFQHWSRYFRIRAHIERGSLDYQDYFVLEHEGAPVSVRGPAATARERSREAAAAAPEAAAGAAPEAAAGHAAPDVTGAGAAPEAATGAARAVPVPPIPPLEYRRMVGRTKVSDFDNPTGELIYPDVPEDLYETVFDFGCGCGRVARQLLQQKVRPSRYVGIDIDRAAVRWCTDNLSPLDPNFRFYHHDIYDRALAPENTRQMTARFPSRIEEFSLILANSVFTHLCQGPAEYYLYEIARILKPDGVARTSWFFFDKDSFTWLAESHACLFVSDVDPTSAVIYDRRWFLQAVCRCGLGVRRTLVPTAIGQQWVVQLERRTAATVDRFPLGEEAAEWVCGATRKAIPSE